MAGLAELQRRAYARDSSAQERAEAEAELALLRGRIATEFELPRPPLWSRPHRLWMLGLVVAALLGGAIVAGAQHPPSSLLLFERTQDSRDLEAPTWLPVTSYHNRVGDRPDLSSLRWLTSVDEWEVYVYLTETDGLCLRTASGLSGGGKCTSLEAFERYGIVYSFATRPVADPDYISIFWGPTGAPRVYDQVPEELYRAGVEGRIP
jgi:hypothetical protein